MRAQLGRLQLCLVLVALAALGTTAGPAAAQTNTYTIPAQTTLNFASLKVKGYTLNGTFTQEGSKKTLFLNLFKGTRTTQNHNYQYTKGITFSHKADLSAASASVRLGSLGRINMRFRFNRATRTTAPQEGCTGPRQKSRRGTFSGRNGFKFVPGPGFGRFVTSSFRNATLTAQPKQTCTFNNDGGQENRNPSLNTSGDGKLNFFVTETPAGVSETFTLEVRASNPRITRSIFAFSPDRSMFEVGDKADYAYAKAIGPWITGRVDYSATDYFIGGSNGKLRGNMEVRFDGSGVRRPFIAGDVLGNLFKPGFTPPPPPNKPPTANFSWTETGSPREIQFNDESTDPDGNIQSWAWDFGDGTTSTLPNPTHTYGAAGTYSVKLTVTDDRGAKHDVTKSNVTVTNPPPEPPADPGGGQEEPLR